jgi:hypothetical protein
MHAKNTMREKSFKTKQLQKHSHENRAQTTEKKEMQTKKKPRRITQQTSWEVAGSRVRTSKEEREEMKTMISSLAQSDPGLLLRTKKRTKRDKVKAKRDEQSVDRNRLEKGKMWSALQ